MKDVISRKLRSRWVAVTFGLLIAFFLMAPLFAALAERAPIEATPAFFLVGTAALVKVAAIIFDPQDTSLYLWRIRAGLVLAGVLYFFVSVLMSS